MSFRVVTLSRAERDFNAILDYIAARSRTGAEAWARAFDKARLRSFVATL
jgi:plasmid stabilization system protein ParE